MHAAIVKKKKKDSINLNTFVKCSEFLCLINIFTEAWCPQVCFFLLLPSWVAGIVIILSVCVCGFEAEQAATWEDEQFVSEMARACHDAEHSAPAAADENVEKEKAAAGYSVNRFNHNFQQLPVSQAAVTVMEDVGVLPSTGEVRTDGLRSACCSLLRKHRSVILAVVVAHMELMEMSRWRFAKVDNNSGDVPD